MAHRAVWRLVLIAPLATILLLVLAAAVAWLSFDPNAYKDRIAAAVERQTGRRLSLNGKLHLAFTPVPTLSAEDVALANLPGGSRPQMVTASRVSAEIAWLPLLQRRVVITRLTLEKPDLLLEREAQGNPNWRLVQVLPQTSHPEALSTPEPAAARTQGAAVQGLRLVDGTVAWHGAQDFSLAVSKADLDETAPDAPIALSAAATYDATPFEIVGTFGSLLRLRDTQATDPWHVKLSAKSDKASLELDGSFAGPSRLQGYDLSVTARAADLGLVQPLFPEIALPALRDLRVTGHVTDAAPLPKISELLVHAGASDLTSVLPGVTLAALDIAVPGPDQPMHATASGNYAGAKLQVDLSAGPPAALLPTADDAPFPLDLAVEMAGATVHVHGALARPRSIAGLQASLDAQIPDVAAFVPVARRELPALHDVSLAAAVTDRDGLLHGLALQDLRLRLPQADLTGSASFDFAGRPALDGHLSGKHIDLDALRAAWRPAGPTPADPAGSDNPAPRPPTKPAPGPFVIPDTRFAFDALRRGDADLRLDLGELVWHGVAYRSVAGHLLLKDGHLLLDPAAASSPAGAASGRLEIDAAKSPARVALVLHSPGLALKPLLTEFGRPDDVIGVLQVEADLRGAGDTPHQVAADADGYLGLSLVNGLVDGGLVAQVFGGLLRAVRLPGEGFGSGRSELRCFALRLDAEHGIAAVQSFYLSVSRLRVAGSGTADFGRETLSLNLRPFVEVAGTGLVVPLHVGGTFRRPTSSIDVGGTPEAVAAQAERLAKEGSKLTPITSAIAAAGEKLLGEADTGNCAPALEAARNGKPGPEPAPLKPDKKSDKVDDLFKRLFK